MALPFYPNSLSLEQIFVEYGDWSVYSRDPLFGTVYVQTNGSLAGNYYFEKQALYTVGTRWYFNFAVLWNGRIVVTWNYNGIGEGSGDTQTVRRASDGWDYRRDALQQRLNQGQQGVTVLYIERYSVYRDKTEYFQDTRPHALNEYYSGTLKIPGGTYGYPPPTFNTAVVIPPSGTIGIGNFFGAGSARIINTVFGGYSPSFSHNSGGNLDVASTGFGRGTNLNLTSTRIPINETWNARLSVNSTTFTTGGNSAGYSLRLTNTRGLFLANYSSFCNILDFFGICIGGEFERYFRLRNFGYQLRRGNAVAATVYNPGSPTPPGGEIGFVGGWNYWDTGEYTFNIFPNSTYTLYHYLEFKADSHRGYLATDDHPNDWFYGYTTEYGSIYFTEL